MEQGLSAITLYCAPAAAAAAAACTMDQEQVSPVARRFPLLSSGLSVAESLGSAFSAPPTRV